MRWPQLEAGTTRESTYELCKENSIVGDARMEIRVLAAARVIKSITEPERAGNTNSHTVEKLKQDLSCWRNTHSVKTAQQWCKSNSDSDDLFTMADLCSEGCLDTLAAIRVGFKPEWSSEVDPAQSRMYSNLTGKVCLGDTFGAAVSAAPRVHYIKSGQPCTDWSSSGHCGGGEGMTGWMFIRQTEVILSKMPQIFRLEISDNAQNVDEGKAILMVVSALESKYVIYQRLIEVWKFGDPSNKKLIFIVGIDKN